MPRRVVHVTSVTCHPRQPRARSIAVLAMFRHSKCVVSCCGARRGMTYMPQRLLSGRASSAHSPTVPPTIQAASRTHILPVENGRLRSRLNESESGAAPHDAAFCILDNLVLGDPAQAAAYLYGAQIGGSAVKLDGLLRRYQADVIKQAVVSFILAPSLPETRALIADALASLTASSIPNMAESVLDFLRALANTGAENTYTMLLSRLVADALATVNKHRRRELFACLVQANMKFENVSQQKALQNLLLGGSQLDKFVARTGYLDPKWHDMNTCVFTDTHRAKMLRYFSFRDLHYYANHAIKSNDITDSSLYLELLVSKFELTASPSGLQLRMMLNTMLLYLMAYRGAKECLDLLDHISDSGIEIRPATLLKILTHFRRDEQYTEALVLINYLHNEPLHPRQKAVLVKEIMLVITNRFAHQPQVVVGYFAALFEKPRALTLLSDLGILNYMHTATDPSDVQVADIHADLMDLPLRPEYLKDIYLVAFKNMAEVEKSSAQVVLELYRKYVTHQLLVVDDSVVTVFLNHLLKKDPYSEEMALIKQRANYDAAMEIFADFVKTSHVLLKPYLFDLLISSSLLSHNDLTNATWLIKRAQESTVALTFNQIAPFVIYHYSRDQLHQAQQWYGLLLQHGVRANSVAADQIFDIAREQGWKVTGSAYKSSVRQKKRTARSQLQLLGRADQVEESRDSNLAERLGAILVRAKSVYKSPQ